MQETVRKHLMLWVCSTFVILMIDKQSVYPQISQIFADCGDETAGYTNHTEILRLDAFFRASGAFMSG